MANLRITISPQDLERQFQVQFRTASAPLLRQMLRSMGRTFYSIVIANFGASGIDRPSPWPMLSKKYARRVGRPYATLVKSGRLRASGRVVVKSESVEITFGTNETPYATAHQFGEGHMPLRPYFPINSRGELTEYAKTQIVQALERDLE